MAILAEPIADLPLRRKTREALIAAGYNVLGDLARTSRERLMLLSGFTPSMLGEVETLLSDKHLAFGTDTAKFALNGENAF